MSSDYISIKKGKEFHNSVMQRLLSKQKEITVITKGAPDFNFLFRIAAFLYWFTEEQLKNIVKSLPEQVDIDNLNISIDNYRTLFQDCDHRGNKDNTTKRRLKLKIRKKVLGSYKNKEAELNDWISILERLGVNCDPHLMQILKNSEFSNRNLNNPELRGRLRVYNWVEELLDINKERDELKLQIKKQEILSPFFKLTEHFRGRKAELKTIRSYVNYLPSETFLERLQRFTRSLSLSDHPPLVITGIGGVGKSTLIAKFILDHINHSHTEKDLVFVYIDFDQINISLREPLDVLKEVVDQLRSRFSLNYDSWNLLSKELADYINLSKGNFNQRDGGVINKGNISSIYEQKEFLDKFAELCATNLIDNMDAPILLVLDSFEEVQRTGDGPLMSFFDFFQVWIRYVPNIRLVIAGRAPISSRIIKTQQISLKEFDKEAAKGYLEVKGIKDQELINHVINNYNLHPLTLKLIIELLKKTDFTKTSLNGISKSTFFRFKVNESRVQQELFDRNLDHIEDLRVRKIAFPGMVVRYITPEIIIKVLAKPCELEDKDIIDIESVFSALSNEKFLVEDSGSDGLKFRKDLRQLILPLVYKKGASKARQINVIAIKYYEGRSDVQSRAEYVYHAIQNGIEYQSLKELLTPELETLLIPSMDEMPKKAQVFLARHYDLPLSDELMSSADIEEWEATLVNSLMNANRDKSKLKALRFLQKRFEERKGSDRSANSTLFTLEGWLNLRLGNLEEASYAFKNASESFSGKLNTEMYLLRNKCHANLLEIEGKYRPSLRKVTSIISRQIKANEWNEDIVNVLVQLIRLYFRIGTDNKKLVLQINELLIRLVVKFPGAKLNSTLYNRAFWRVFIPFLASAKRFVNSKRTFKYVNKNWLSKYLNELKDSRTSKGNDSYKLLKQDLDQLNQIVISEEENKEFDYLDRSEFNRLYQRFDKRIRNKSELEEISQEVLSMPLRQFVAPGVVEISKFELFVEVEAQRKLKDLSYELDKLEGVRKPKSISRDDIKSEQQSDIDFKQQKQKQEQAIKRIKTLIAQAKLEQAISQFHEIAKESNKDLINDATLLKGRFNSIERSNLRGLVSRSEYAIQINKLSHSLLSMLNDFEESY